MKKLLVVVICALSVVAFASNMTYEQQTIVPELRELLKNKPYESFLSLFEVTYWGKNISVETRGYYYFVEFLIRKFTHFAGYGVLAVIFFIFYRKARIRIPSILAFITIFIIASLDEYRQSFSPGRTGLFNDVIIDASGAFFFLLVVNCVMQIKNRLFMNRQSKS